MKTAISCGVAFVSFLSVQTTQACTTFNLMNTESNVVGKNHDWYPNNEERANSCL